MKSFMMHGENDALVDFDNIGIDPSAQLRKLCLSGLEEAPGMSVEFKRSRCKNLKCDLEAIEAAEATQYFSILGSVGRFAADQGILIHARGIAAGSSVLHALCLTDVCPNEYSLTAYALHSTLAAGPPDIDLNTESPGIDKILRFLRSRYGEDQTTVMTNDSPLARKPNWTFRIDFLEDVHLDLLAAVVSKIHEDTHEEFQVGSIPLTDRRTFDLLVAGDTAGIPYFSNEDSTRLLQRVQPTCFRQLIAILAIQRPSLLSRETVRQLANLNGGKTDPAHPSELNETGGLVLYREQVMQVMSRLTDMSNSEIYEFLSTCVRGPFDRIDTIRDRYLLTAARELGVEKANEMFDKLCRAARITDMKCNAAARALVGYRAAYLKTHYATQFEHATAIAN